MHAALNLRNIIREFIKQRLKHLLRPSFFSYIFLAALYLLSGFRKGYLAFSILTSSVCFLATGSIIISLLQVHIYHFKLSWSCREWSACEGSWEEVDSVTHCADQPWGIHSLCFTQSLFVIMSSHTLQIKVIFIWLLAVKRFPTLCRSFLDLTSLKTLPGHTCGQLMGGWEVPRNKRLASGNTLWMLD